MEFNWFSLAEEKRNRWINLCPKDSYRIVAPSAIAGLLPDSLIRKYDSVLLVSSGIAGGGVVFMANGMRVDKTEIDQMPFGFGMLNDGANTSGVLIQHGNWEQRTKAPPTDFWQYLQSSGIGNCYPLDTLPTTQSGDISRLSINTQTSGAFVTLVKELKTQFSGLA